ncbi:MAG: helix-turn-helix transcriptional regulator [Eubacteriales bacterium]
MNDKYQRQLKKGILDMLVLNLLQVGPKYGYQIIQELKEQSGEIIVLKDGTLYPVLYRLEDELLVVSNWKEGEGKQVPRKYYEITKEGVQVLGEIKRSWNQISHCVNEMIGGEEHE